MILKPSNAKELSRGLAHAFALGEKVERVEPGAFNRIVEHTPEDMTVTVESGITLAVLQSELARRGQWLPVDPPNPERLTVRDLLEENASGPRRFGFGTVRDYVIGLKITLPDGRAVKSGGKVVKNVAGYDLAKLFIGSRGSLGVIAEATFKLRPLPEAESFIRADYETLEQAERSIVSVLDSELTPVVLDLHNLSTHNIPMLVLGFAGTREEVDWQSEKARGLGLIEPANLDYEKRFWSDETPAQRLSVLPSMTVETIGRLGDTPFVARAGNGVIYHRGAAGQRKNDLPAKLMRRLKKAFDPKQILPDLPL